MSIARWWVLSALLLGACDGSEPGASKLSDASSDAGAGFGRDAASGDDDDTAGDGDDSNGDGDADVGVPDYGDPMVLPDVDTTKVSSCSGKPDLTLCEVVTTPDRWYDVCLKEVCVSPGCGAMSCNTNGPHFVIPPSRDHHYFEREAGAEPVTVDLITGLHWQTCAAGATGEGCDQGAARKLDPSKALAYCDALGWAGHDDWYLPDLYELFSLVDFANADSSRERIARAVFVDGADVLGLYWSTTFYDNDPLAFDTAKNSTGFGMIRTEEEAWVHCVRRGFSRPASTLQRYTTEREGTVVMDARTALAWQNCSVPYGETACASGGGVTPEQIGEHCAKLSFGGYTDWRAPTWKELQTFFDFTKRSFPDEPWDPVLGGVSGPYLLSSDGLLALDDSTLVGGGSTYQARCVRGPLAAP